MKETDELQLLFDRLWPIHRSITGEGNRRTLEILSEIVPIELHEVPSEEIEWRLGCSKRVESKSRIFNWTLWI